MDNEELFELDKSNWELIEAQANELARLRADLAEAHADVQRFEAALDASQRELAEALKDRKRLSAMLEMELKRGIRKERKLRKTIRALVVAARAMDRTGGGELDGEYWYPTVRGVLYEMQQAERQGKE